MGCCQYVLRQWDGLKLMPSVRFGDFAKGEEKDISITWPFVLDRVICASSKMTSFLAFHVEL